VQVKGMLPTDGSNAIYRIFLFPATDFDTTLANLAGLLNNQTWDSIFTGNSNVLLQYLGSFGMRSYAAEIDLSNLAILSSNLQVGATSALELFDGKIVLDTFDVTWLLFDPFNNGINMVNVAANVTLFDDLKFFGSITIPEMSILVTLTSPVTLSIGDWLDTLTNGFGTPSVPQNIKDSLNSFTIENVSLSYNYTSSIATVHTNGTVDVLGTTVNFGFDMLFSQSNGNTIYDIKATAIINSMSFVADFANDGVTTCFSISFESEANPINTPVLLGGLGFDTVDIPTSLDLGLKSFEFDYSIDNTTPSNSKLTVQAESVNWGKAILSAFNYENEWVYYFGLKVDSPINLANLPLVDQILSPEETLGVDDITVILASQAITPAMVSTFNRDVAPGFPTVPAEGLNSQIGLSVDFNFGGYLLPVSFGFADTDQNNGKSTANSTSSGTATGNTNNAAPNSSPGNSDGTIWFNVQKSVGPVDIEAIGVRYVDNVLWVALNAEITVAGLSISMDGAAVGSPLDSFEPQFQLDGLGIDFSTPAFEIGGALLNMRLPEPDFEYAGILVARILQLSLGVTGAYGKVDGKSTMFLFGQLSGLAIGQPYFMIKGFSGGFGYNSSLRLPGMTELFQFPMIAGLTNPSAMGGEHATPMDALNVLMGVGGGEAWVSPDVGQYWVAAGLEISSFDIINLNTLAILELGNEFSVSLLGLANAKFPMEGSLVYAYVELQVMAAYKDAEGVLDISAVLSPNSFLLDPSAKLTGGFGFSSWFKGEHAGDFVLTVGGYNPNFSVPAWYPQIPRVGFSWSLDSMVTVNGGAYLAMTPAAIMAGGNLDLKFEDEGLKAWFSANADMIIWYQPFNFEAEIGVTVGVSYTMDNLFTNKTITAEVGANLNLWGPPTGGTVTVHWWVLSFSIDFGASKEDVDDAAVAEWSDFVKLLPPVGSSAQINALSGMTGQDSPALSGNQNSQNVAVVELDTESTSESQPAWLIARDGFAFQTASVVPAYQLYLGKTNNTPHLTADKLNILPMQMKDLESSQRIYLFNLDTNTEIDLSNWTVTTPTENVPTALWGSATKRTVPDPNNSLLKDQNTGIRVEAPDATEGPGTGEIDLDNLAFLDLPGTAESPLQTNQAASGTAPTLSTDSIDTISDEINATTATTNRDALFTALGTLNYSPVTNDGRIVQGAEGSEQGVAIGGRGGGVDFVGNRVDAVRGEGRGGAGSG
ncbi:MAG: DUF6603 domain-containing protein, partial [Bacteroidota bacterium]